MATVVPAYSGPVVRKSYIRLDGKERIELPDAWLWGNQIYSDISHDAKRVEDPIERMRSPIEIYNLTEELFTGILKQYFLTVYESMMRNGTEEQKRFAEPRMNHLNDLLERIRGRRIEFLAEVEHPREPLCRGPV